MRPPEHMTDDMRKSHFDLHGRSPKELSKQERIRIESTVEMVPREWKTIVDVGCGDGRVGGPLLQRGQQVLGLDWSAESIRHFPGRAMACDIREPFPVSERPDGAVCCEVLEHLTRPEADRVINQLREVVRLGFLVTVPAREPQFANMHPCEKCGKTFHVWGHVQFFDSFESVDRMVGATSVKRRFIPYLGLRPSPFFTKIQRSLGVHPYDPSYLCPWCGEPIPPIGHMPLWKRSANKAVALLQRATSQMRPEFGWFACLYAK